MYHPRMLPRLRRRHLLRRVAFTALSLVLFAGAVWLALVLAGSSPSRTVRVLRGASSPSPQYTITDQEGTVRVREQVGPGQARELELKATEEGVLIRPVPEKQ